MFDHHLSHQRHLGSSARRFSGLRPSGLPDSVFCVPVFCVPVFCVPVFCVSGSRIGSWTNLFVRILAALFLLVLVSPQSVAQSAAVPDEFTDFPGLDIQASLGWDGYIDHTEPMPISFLVSNFSETMLVGEILLSDPITGNEINLGEVAIGPNGVKRLSSVHSLADWEDCIATYTNGAKTFWKRPLSLIAGKDLTEELNYLLVLDDGGRRVQFPPKQLSPQEIGMGRSTDPSRFEPELGRGNHVQALSLRAWELPTHHGPLMMAQGLVMPEAFKLESLNEPQWNALARWICLGGTIYLHETLTEVFEHLKKITPLAVQPRLPNEDSIIYVAGLGTIQLYSGKVFSGSETSALVEIASAVAKRPKLSSYAVMANLRIPDTESGTSEKTKRWVLYVFGGYAFLSGVVTLFLFRRTRRSIAIFTVGVVAAACVSAAALGVKLRQSRGDVNWLSVSHLVPGGIVQSAHLKVQSAGGRNFRLAADGPQIDLQLDEQDDTENSYYSYRYRRSYTAWPPFSIQENRSEIKNTFQINVPVSPWGNRTATAVAFQPDVEFLKLELQYDPPQVITNRLNDYFSSLFPAKKPHHLVTPLESCLDGVWKFKVENKTPYQLNNCSIVLMRSICEFDRDPDMGWGQLNASTSTSFRLAYEKTSYALGTLVANAEISRAFGTLSQNWNEPEERWNYYSSAYNDNLADELPLPFPGATAVWFIGGLADSPALGMNDDQSDFELSGEPTHYIVQRIGDHELPRSWQECHAYQLQRQIRKATLIQRQKEANETNTAP